MPAKEVITRDKILRAAEKLLREEGIEAVNARSVAKRLACSTQPLYRIFGDMDGLKAALKDYAERVYRERVAELRDSNACKPYEAYGLGYIRFAREDKHLFRYLYSGERQGRTDIEDVHMPQIIATIMAEYGFSESAARALHADMAVFCYGLAFMVNTKYAEYGDEEIIARLKTEFSALAKIYGAG